MQGEQDTRQNLFLLSSSAQVACKKGRQPSSRTSKAKSGSNVFEKGGKNISIENLFDVDCNLTHDALIVDAEELLSEASGNGVNAWLVPGSCIEDSLKALSLKQMFKGRYELHVTAGIHPYNVVSQLKSFPLQESLSIIREKIDQVVAVGEIGIDLSDGFPSLEEQLPWFEQQVHLACGENKSIFLHERLAHDHVVGVLSAYKSQLPPVLVHCFTGTAQELRAYIDMGCYVSFAGLICRTNSGKALRDAIVEANVPLDKVMIETDAPYLGFPGCRPSKSERKKVFPNVPAALPLVALELSKLLNVSPSVLASSTTSNARRFLRI